MTFRLFKTRYFAASASKAWICDSELKAAFGEMLNGQADNLGGGVWKKRLNENRHRSIILAKGRHYWVYQFLFAKQDQSNISQKELAGFRTLAKAYEGLNDVQIQQLLDLREFVEIHHDQKI
ncbi:type II toxin-antitoxin system RelE/ParE family toxin [Pseudomonas sp. ADAK18]|uniref:type II toxin-antitoxin system RelE/ParE family toxin n=1 Tax=Pseudomonas sp. ADAK18 TaxID=2730848 RepID=UPI0014643EA9|nr:type II toxin-antitoxin system RelE/ParE family toxin [Pseudomonas sp. ADAK18]QJI31419.1 type II toxin-antitoxin system RelE/ParE family toxin [Pseudomonas sp. ADAK18]